VRQEALADLRPSHELTTCALTDPEDYEASWAVTVLQYRGTREVFDIARDFCHRECPQERTLGADILARLGEPDRPLAQEAFPILQSMAARESDDDVLESVVWALGHHRHLFGMGPFIGFRGHPAASVRQAVAGSLWGEVGADAVAVLIELSRDPVASVRDWACFGLGTTIDTDTADLRAALTARTDDSDEVTRVEAILGLARRRDERAFEPLARELTAESVNDKLFEAAAELGDPRLHDVLCKWRHFAEPGDYWLNEAIERCRRGCARD
jgi:HEAT repeat protein